MHQDLKLADIGAGGGYYGIRSAKRVAVVFVVDTDPNFLGYIEERAERRGIENIQFILVKENDLTLPGQVDLIFMRNVCHHLKNRVKYFKDLNEWLKPGGRVALIEYRKVGGLSFRGLFGHHVPQERLEEEMKKAGYSLVQEFNFLPEQSFTIYEFSSHD